MGGLSALLMAGLAGYGAWESLRHVSNLRRIPVRIHVNGTRGSELAENTVAGRGGAAAPRHDELGKFRGEERLADMQPAERDHALRDLAAHAL